MDMNYLQKRVSEFITYGELCTILETNTEPIIKFGIDPTSSNMHLGHTVPLRVLKNFQDNGYIVSLLIGDFTARVGDPSGVSKIRQLLEREDVNKNIEGYLRQAGRVLNLKETRILYNNTWLSKLTLEDAIDLFSKGNINSMIKRRGISSRLENNEPISVLEFVYPFFQGLDSVEMHADVEIGGEDQRFNFTFTRDLQSKYGMKPEAVIIVKTLRGKDGSDKMSKSMNNHIPVTDDPHMMYGGIMSAIDDVIINYYELLTNMSDKELEEIRNKLANGVNPMLIKEDLAYNITESFYGKDLADKSKERFDLVYRQRKMPKDIDVVVIKNQRQWDIAALLLELGMVKTKSEGRRLIEQKAIRINDKLINDKFYNVDLGNEPMIGIGKNKVMRVKYEN